MPTAHCRLPISDCLSLIAMLKFILFVLVFFLAIRMIMRVLKIGVHFFSGESPRRSERASGSFSTGKQIVEADYEVIESHLKDKERQGGK